MIHLLSAVVKLASSPKKTVGVLSPTKNSGGASASVKPVASRIPSYKPAIKTPSLPTRASKSYDVSCINPPKTKTSASVGIVWIPTKKNKNKDVVYNPHNYDHYKERSSTTNNL